MRYSFDVDVPDTGRCYRVVVSTHGHFEIYRWAPKDLVHEASTDELGLHYIEEYDDLYEDIGDDISAATLKERVAPIIAHLEADAAAQKARDAKATALTTAPDFEVLMRVMQSRTPNVKPNQPGNPEARPLPPL